MRGGVEYTVNDDCIRCLGSDGHCWNNSTDDGDIEQHVQRSCYYSYCPDGSATTTHCSAPLPPHKSELTYSSLLSSLYYYCRQETELEKENHSRCYECTDCCSIVDVLHILLA